MDGWPVICPHPNAFGAPSPSRKVGRLGGGGRAGRWESVDGDYGVLSWDGIDDGIHQLSPNPLLSQRRMYRKRTVSTAGRGGGDPSTTALPVNGQGVVRGFTPAFTSPPFSTLAQTPPNSVYIGNQLHSSRP